MRRQRSRFLRQNASLALRQSGQTGARRRPNRGQNAHGHAELLSRINRKHRLELCSRRQWQETYVVFITFGVIITRNNFPFLLRVWLRSRRRPKPPSRSAGSFSLQFAWTQPLSRSRPSGGTKAAHSLLLGPGPGSKFKTSLSGGTCKCGGCGIALRGGMTMPTTLTPWRTKTTRPLRSLA